MKVAKRLGALTRSRPFLTSYAAIKVYTAMVLPVFDYCDVVLFYFILFYKFAIAIDLYRVLWLQMTGISTQR